MRGLLFIGRVTFICNLFFVICLLMRHTHFNVSQALREFVIITGWILSVLLNFVFVLGTVVTLARKRATAVPVWLVAVNTFFFLFQIVYRLIFTF